MKFHGIGLPFSPHQSSCSNRTPTNFTWTDDKNESCNVQVWMDRYIPRGILEKRIPGVSKYAWICESKAILPEFREGINNLVLFDALINSYDGIFTCDQELVDMHEKIHFCFAGSNLPWTPETDYKIHDKTELCSFLSSPKQITDGHHLRHRIYNKFKRREHGEHLVHLFGSISNHPIGVKHNCHMPGHEDNGWHDKGASLHLFRFQIVVENTRYDDYFTEKLTDCFATGTIPLYYGPKNIGKYFNTDGIIQIDEDESMIDFIVNNRLTEDLYLSKMDAIKDNFERVKNLQMADDMLFDKIQELESQNVSIKGGSPYDANQTLQSGCTYGDSVDLSYNYCEILMEQLQRRNN